MKGASSRFVAGVVGLVALLNSVEHQPGEFEGLDVPRDGLREAPPSVLFVLPDKKLSDKEGQSIGDESVQTLLQSVSRCGR